MTIIDWDTLRLPEYEDKKTTLQRLGELTAASIAAQGLSYRPEAGEVGFRPSPAQARQVAVMACLGLNDKAISNVLNISPKMLKFYYSKEMKTSPSLANAVVAQQALMMATSGQHPDMTKFWLKTRAGWKETTAVEMTGKDGAPIETTTAKDRLKAMLAAKQANKASAKGE